jgi:hypothetical protein
VRSVTRRLSLICVAVATSLFTALLYGQQSQTLRDRDPDLDAARKLHEDLQQANFHSGPFYLWSRLRLSDAGYTEAAYVPTGEQSGGLSLSVEAPQRFFFVPRKKTIVTLDLVPGYSFFSSGGSRGQFNYLARGDVHFLLNHLYLDVYALRADQLRAHVADFNRLATAREDETGVSGEAKYSSRTSGLFTIRYRDTSYPNNRFQPDLETLPQTDDYNPVHLLDRNERNARASIVHKTFPLTSLFVSAEVSNYGFRSATYKDSRRTWYGGGFHYESGRTSLRAEAGPLKLSFKDASQHDYSGLGGNINWSRGNGRWKYAAGAEHDLGFSIFADNNYFISDSAHVGVDYTASRRLSLNANIAAERDTYEVQVRGNDREDTVSFSSVGFSYQIRRFRTGLDVGWYERESTFGGDTDSGIRYVVHLSFVP